MDFQMLMNHHFHLPPSLYEQYIFVTKYKTDFHRIYIQARKDTRKTWHPLPYLVTKNDLLAQIQQCPV